MQLTSQKQQKDIREKNKHASAAENRIFFICICISSTGPDE